MAGYPLSATSRPASIGQGRVERAADSGLVAVPGGDAGGVPALHDGASGYRMQDGAPPVLVVTKLYPPAVRDQVVVRERLVERLRAGSGNRLTLVACPAGFGKTTLLAGWREVEAARRPVAWLKLDDGDNDPLVLWSYVIEALRRVCPAIGQSASPEPDGTASIVDVVLPRLVNELHTQGEVVLILDDFHRLSAGAARDSIAWFVDHAPATFQLVLSTRTEPALPLAALRAHSELLELRADDLRFTSEEANAFLNGRLGLGLAPADLDCLVDRMDGWPAGLYLTALSLEQAADRHAFVNELDASSRHVIDFLQMEVLAAHDQPTQELMLRCSILERLSGPLCDATMEQQDSAEMLEALSHSNLFLAPLEGDGRWYRFEPLFAQLLRVELERREPGLASVLHRRAYAWHRDHGTAGEAIHHAIEAGAYGEAAELIKGSWVSYARSRMYDTVLGWIRRFPAGILSGDAGLLLAEAWLLSLSGKREAAARAIAAVEWLGTLGVGPLPDGFSSAEASLTMLRAAVPWGDVGVQLENARRAAELEGPGSPLRPVACWAVGMGLYFRGEISEADRWFAESSALAPGTEQWLAGGSSLAYRSLIAGERGRLEEQRLIAEQASELVQERGTQKASGAVSLALGVSLAARGQPEEAAPLIERGIAALRSSGQHAEVAMALLHQGSVLRILGERERSEAAIAEARAIIESCPDPGILTGRLAALDHSPQARTGCGDRSLTSRELRVLRLLTGNLSERDIGRELYVSYSTVHSHARSIYRKLGVSSRAGALERAQALGLLTGGPHLRASPREVMPGHLPERQPAR
jgi:LuxR family transcriptional regulator, maltose regulon positive regulatory protein